MKIAICEDEQWFALSLKEKIESFCSERNDDADVAIYSDGGSFLAACESGERFDAVFMDINLGKGADGVDTIAKLRENGNTVQTLDEIVEKAVLMLFDNMSKVSSKNATKRKPSLQK